MNWNTISSAVAQGAGIDVTMVTAILGDDGHPVAIVSPVRDDDDNPIAAIARDLAEAVAAATGDPSPMHGALCVLRTLTREGHITGEGLDRLQRYLPGAAGIMARAMGLGEATLRESLREAPLAAGEALPRFAAELQATAKERRKG